MWKALFISIAFLLSWNPGLIPMVDVLVNLAAGAQEREEFVVPLDGLDPVLLTGGKEVQGEEAFSVKRGRFRYLFANAETKATFEREPGRYEIQLDGTCARMGPTVQGNPDLFAVHEG